MGLNKSKGNMYEFITHTWNPIKGACYHDCSYCYMKKWGKLKPVRIDENEFKTDLGTDNFIFVGSGCDIFAKNIPSQWIEAILCKCEHSNNKYLFQTKNPERFEEFEFYEYDNIALCVTVESNRYYPEFMINSPQPLVRFFYMPNFQYITIEPIMDFDLNKFVQLIKVSYPKQINIGADSGNNHLPEPSKEKILELISELKKFTIVHKKKNLNRLLK